MEPTELRARMRDLLLDPDALVRGVASGRAAGRSPQWRRVELRPVQLKAGPRLQITAFSATQAFTSNHEWRSPDTASAVDVLLDDGFGEWTVDTAHERARMRVGRGGAVGGGIQARENAAAVDMSHDRAKPRLLPLTHPVLRATGLTTASGEVKPSRHDKLRQVDEFLRVLDASLRDAGLVPRPEGDPIRVLDLGCGNAYLTFAAHAYLESVGVEARIVGIDSRNKARDRNAELARELGVGDSVTFEAAQILEASTEVAGAPADVVMALHACDTASDDALAVAVRGGARLILVAPCCHHDLQRQLADRQSGAPFPALTRHGILRERFGDVLTDAVRADLMRLLGHRVDVIEFIGSQHTPRNTLLRAVRTGVPADRERWHECDTLVGEFGITPRLAVLLADELGAARAGSVEGVTDESHERDVRGR